MKAKTIIVTAFIACGILLLNSCASIPKNAKPVENFDVHRYLGAWYEIARFDFRFEKDLDNTSAQYEFNKQGNVIVAALKVSFFGPFYSGYNVVALDENYQYALIAGKNLDYLWILSRTKTIPEDIKTKYLKIAEEIGYDTSKLIWVKHDKTDSPYLNEN